MISELTLAMVGRLGLATIAKTIHPYPTFSEANKSVATEWRKKSIPQRLLPIAQRYFAWKRGDQTV